MKNDFPGGVWPVMLTPFTKEDQVDYGALERLIDWYIDSGVSGLFAVCQSSEMFFLSLEERVEIARFTKEKAVGRVPVIASGHVSDSFEDQVKELHYIADTGVDAVILITNRIASEHEDDTVFIRNLTRLTDEIPPHIPLGFYECPYPYKRLISPETMKSCAETGRFFFHKDTCCDAEQIKNKLVAIRGTNLKLYNANTTTLLRSMRDGAAGYSGVMANFHPWLYKWLYDHYQNEDRRVQQVLDFLTLASALESRGYPANAKFNMNLCGIPMESVCRSRGSQKLLEHESLEVESLIRLEAYIKEQLSL